MDNFKEGFNDRHERAEAGRCIEDIGDPPRMPHENAAWEKELKIESYTCGDNGLSTSNRQW